MGPEPRDWAGRGPGPGPRPGQGLGVGRDLGQGRAGPGPGKVWVWQVRGWDLGRGKDLGTPPPRSTAYPPTPGK